jgi:hypothetical protein
VAIPELLHAEKMGNKENVAWQAITLRIINDLTRKKENVTSRRGQDGDLRVHSLVLQLYFYKGCIVSEGLSNVPTNYRASAESLPKLPHRTIRLLSNILLGVSVQYSTVD